VLLDQMPSARPHEQRGDAVAQPVRPSVRRLVGDRPAHGRLHVGLTLHDVLPQRRVRVLEVGHEDARAGVERVDDHLAVDGAGDLDAAILQVVGRGRDRPVTLADRTGVGKKVRPRPGAQRVLAPSPGLQQLAPARLEATREVGDERERVGREDARGVVDLGPVDRECGAHPAAPGRSAAIPACATATS
jgi:hypothetical protein